MASHMTVTRSVDMWRTLPVGVSLKASPDGLFLGQMRDWNEELQSVRELPADTSQLKLFRDRTLFKVRTVTQLKIKINGHLSPFLRSLFLRFIVILFTRVDGVPWRWSMATSPPSTLETRTSMSHMTVT